MSKVSDYKIEKFVSLKDTPNEYVPGKYVTVEADGIDYGDVDTSTSGVSGGGLNYNYYFDTATSGTLASGTIRLDSDNYPAVSSIDISYHDKDDNDLSDWINSWDDSDKSIKGTLTLQSASKANKYAMFKLTETVDTTFGSGKDGDVTISGAINLNTTAVASGRTYADMIAYNVSTVGSNSCQTTETPNGIEAGDAVLLINLQGAGNSQVANTGNYEVFIVDNIVSTTVTFKSGKTKLYGNNGGDTNLGTGADKQKVMLMRIPQYDNLEITSAGSLTANNWNGSKYGVLAVMCKTAATIIGKIDMDIKGFRGGTAGGYNSGGSYGRNQANLGGAANLGGGGCHRGDVGGGAGHATNGTGGVHPGASYGDQKLTKLYMGSGGGSGYDSFHNREGGHGGGSVLLFAKDLDVYGTVSVLGGVGIGEAGEGSGGSVLIKSNKLSMHSGVVKSSVVGNASAGRIAIYYNALMDSLSNVTPTPYTDSLTSGADKIDYNVDWLNNSGKFDNNEEVIVSYAYNY